MKLGIALIAVSILCLIGSLVITLPGWVNLVGLVTGIGGLFVLTRAKKDGGA